MSVENSTHLPADPEISDIDIDQTVVADEAPREPVQQTFADFGVNADVAAALASAGIVHPFPIQAMTLPVALGGHDIIGQAKTGTGKTLGFGVPLVHRAIGPNDAGFDGLKVPGAPQSLVIVPTRELAVQVARDLTLAASQRSVRVASIYGGRAFEPQVEALKRGVEIVVGTPGRLLDLNRQRLLNLANVKAVVLDEADEMLDLGFLPDVEKLLAATPEVRQTMLFSATMPGPVVAMARRYMSRPTHIRAADPSDEGVTKKDIRQVIYRVHNMDKDEMVAKILQAEGRGRTIIFTKTKRAAAKLSDELTARGFAAAAIHGDLGQGAREQALRAFRNDKVDVLVATDVAARGIDVEDVTHVINFQCPEDEKTYLHRVGRTGRAGHKGTAVTFIDWEDVPRWSLINKALGLDAADPAETYSSSPHLFTDLDIPAGTKGRLPKSARVHAGLSAEKLEDLGETGARKGTSQRNGSTSARGRGRAAHTSDAKTEANEGSQERSTRRPRTRTRTKRTVSEDGAQPVASVTTPRNNSAQGSEQQRTESNRPARRRRRRSGASSRADDQS